MTRDDGVKKTVQAGMSRRYFLQVSAAGAVTATALGASGFVRPAKAAAYDTFTWISPRGTLEVLDDYAYWSAAKMGYFGDMKTEMQPGPSDGTATVKFVDVGQADMGFPSPGVYSFSIQNGMDLISVFNEGALDTFSFAFRKGEGTKDLKKLEGKTILLGSAAWQSITDPLLASQGVDVSKVKYVEAGWPAWGTALQSGQGDAALSWEGLRAEWVAKGLNFEYWLGVQNSKFPANTFVVRKSDMADRDKKAYIERYLRGWAMGLQFGYENPRASVEIVFDKFPTLAKNLGPEIGTTSILQQIHVFRGDMAEREGWGAHDMKSWQAFFDTLKDIGQITKDVKAEDVLTNELIAGANDFDKDKVKSDAGSYELSKDMQAVDIDKIRQHLYDQAI
ncbi:ABC transporter substrate-binding protein [Pararhizobium mangrovi]|uniref:ABC transporter substrate-binding protein n=1 Tax=Pararhizobium mangrovi TaxID=2590452 RepID=A0A506UET4_9HYPH|nr:ABC transporter substrate-binding protein [Pararhizobium mangrovi]TPW30267.1 ABC transporter substrate-binding protein [Pararhizobium mangrovi]